jgi:hypothetical protein
LHETIGNSDVGDLVHLLPGLQELLLQNIWDLADEDLLTMAFVVVEHPLEGQEFIMADEWSQLHSQVLRIQKRILFVVVSNGHTDFVHPEIFEEHWELLSDQLVC